MSESTIEERERAKILAAYILDRSNADPDDDYSVLARQFLRECERRQAEHDAALDQLKSKKIEILIVKGVEGPSMYINNYRVCGNKPWGGGEAWHKWHATGEDVLTALLKGSK